MTAVAVALVIGWALTVAAFLRVLRAERREAKNERETLTNQLLHLAGRTWQQPPRPETESAVPSGRWAEWTTHPDAIDWDAEAEVPVP